MDAAASLLNRRTSKNLNVESLFNFDPLNPRLQLHLQKVYSTLGIALLASALGVYAHMHTHLGGVLTTLGFVACTIWLLSIPSNEEGKRWKILMGAAFLEGASIGVLVESVIEYDPSIVLKALLGTVAMFASFSGAAIFAKRREYLYLGGILSSALSMMLMLRFGSHFFGGASAMFNLELYGGLLLFAGYVVYDTQLIIERADKGDDDYLKHTLDLFLDFVSIFIRVLIILTKNSAEKSRRVDHKRRNRS